MKAVRLPGEEALLSRIEGPVVELAAFGQPRLDPKLAVVLAADVPPDAPPGLVARAVGGVFLALDLADAGEGSFLLGEQLLPPESAGELRMHVGGRLVATKSIAALGDPVSLIGSRKGSLHAGDTVLLGSGPGVPAAPGTLLIEGPLGAVLSADLRGAA
ncbi:hypothetical protein [Amycolatopsis jejuensis]|uniref:hypothetical protein n=1 Tax=Amycolatopsis jejuensis TaxID=330084 RepID=UPI0006918DF9|nr:hypothetical protein [Amycolatopsis jejuensis]